MNRDEQSQPLRRRVQIHDDNSASLIEDSPGFSVRIGRAEIVDVAVPDKEWRDWKTKLATHDFITDNHGEGVRLRRRKRGTVS